MPVEDYLPTKYVINIGLLIDHYEAKGCSPQKAIDCAYRKAQLIRKKLGNRDITKSLRR